MKTIVDTIFYASAVTFLVLSVVLLQSGVQSLFVS